MGRAYDAVTYRDISRHDDVVVDPDVLAVRLDGPLFFANANRFHDQLMALLVGCDPEPNVVVADMEAVAETDTDGADSLTRLAQQLRERGIWFGLARVKGSVLDSWKLAGAIEDVGLNRVFADVSEAVEAGRASVAGARIVLDATRTVPARHWWAPTEASARANHLKIGDALPARPVSQRLVPDETERLGSRRPGGADIERKRP